MRPMAIVCLVTAAGACAKAPTIEVRTYALASIERHAPPVPLDSVEEPTMPARLTIPRAELRRALRELPRASIPPELCLTALTDARLSLSSDSLWALEARRVRTCRATLDTTAAPKADTTVERRHGPYRVAGDTLKLELDDTGFVLERGLMHGDSVVLERGERHRDFTGRGLRWVLVFTGRATGARPQ